MKKWLIITGIALIVFFATAAMMVFAASGGFSQPQTPEQVADELGALLEATVANDASLHNGVLLVDAPSMGVSGVWAAGLADGDSGEAMAASTPFLSASVGKLFTAATVLRLAEEGALSLDDNLTERLPPDVYTGIPVEGGDSALENVTIRMLLGHRSGIPDYFESETADGAPNVMTLLGAEPERSWSPQSLLAYTKEHYNPAGAPGSAFLYSDTNYDLLGLIVEEATGQPFHEFVEQRLLEPLELDRTWYHAHTNSTRDGAPDAQEVAYADVYMGDVNLTGAPALSLDWAGGGLATTTDNLRVFMRSLLQSKPVALDALQEQYTENTLSNGIDYAYGLWRIRPSGLFFMLRGYPDLYGASGSTGAFLYYVPEYDAVISGTFNQTDYQQKHIQFLIRVLDILGKTIPPAS